jgi:calcium-dependent protein kinase
VHRDLKPENILFETTDDDSNIKIVDFGFAAIYNPTQGMKDVLGTPLFIAPEIISEKKYNSAADIWSLGIVTFFLICGYPPFDGEDRTELFSNIKSAKLKFSGKIWKWVSNDWKDFITKWCIKDMKKRPSAEDLLKHQWIVDTPKTDIAEEDILASLNNLNVYSQHNKFQQGVVHFLTYTWAQKEEVNKLSEIFKDIDSNNDGRLTIEEIATYIKKIMGTVNYHEIKDIFAKIDIDKSGYVDYSEFLSATIDKKALLRRDELKQIFASIDYDHSGMNFTQIL